MFDLKFQWRGNSSEKKQKERFEEAKKRIQKRRLNDLPPIEYVKIPEIPELNENID